MRMYLLFSISSVILLSGCATHTISPWDGLTTETTAAVTPLDCGQFPMPTETIKDNNDEMTHGVYDKPTMNDLNDYRKCSEANEAIADEHAQQIGQLKLSRKGLTEAGRAQRNIADLRQTMLEDERRSHVYSSIGYWIAILGMGLAL